MNARGRNLLETCIALNLRILNGRIVGDLEGKKTCFHYNGSSVVDYVIGSKSILRNVHHLSFAIKANFINRDSLETSAKLILTEYNRLFWNIKSKDRLKDGLKSQTVQSRLEAAVRHDSIDTASELISETLVEACKEAGLKARSSKLKCKSQNKWFDQECETEKGNLQSLGEKISKNPNNSELRQLLRDKKKRFKQTCKRKKREYILQRYGHLVNLFNRILDTGKYPALWSFGLIVPIHKNDDRSKVENYRGITLLSALGKLFTSILNNRLYDNMIQKGILKAEQGGFRKMHGTVDSIFTLKMLIDKYVKSNPQKHRNLLFSCFVDFRKVFDCIPRQKLFDKLRKEGVQGRFLEVLISMYSNDKSAV